MDSDLTHADAAAHVDAVIARRRATRSFLDTPVPQSTVRELLRLAAQAPSGSNTQPWRCYVLTGETLARLTAACLHALRTAPEMVKEEYPFYPDPMTEPTFGRRWRFRKALSDAQGIARDDVAGRQREIDRQFTFFGAPVGLIFTIDRSLERASFVCYGCFIQTLMLAAKARGLDTCPQQIWSMMHRILRRELGIPEDELIVCGMALGFADSTAPENSFPLEKLDVNDFTTFMD